MHTTRLAALSLLLSATVATAETYYARNPNDQGQLTLVGYANGTTFAVTALPAGTALFQGTLNQLSRVSVPLTTTREFKLVTSKPVLALVEYDCCNYSGSYFYPTNDGRKYYGTAFTITPLANGANQQWVYAREAAVVTVRDAFGTVVATSPALAADRSWQIPGLVPGQVYTLASTGVIAVQANAGNGRTAVPPRPAAAGTQLEDCNNDEGTVFNFATYSWSRGSIAVFNRGTAAVTFSLRSLADGSAVAQYQNLTVPAGGIFHNDTPLPDLGTATYQLTASGPVTLWAGDQEGGSTVDDMGDDLHSELGWRGQAFLLRTATQGATLFAYENGTSVTRSNGGPPVTVTLNADQFLSLTSAANLKQTFSVTATRPISAQVTGGNGLNDWAVQLRPANRLDTDGNGLDDWAEGGSCTSVAPDTDHDGLYDFADTDDDNDCLADVAELALNPAYRTDATRPNANPNLNCGGTTPVCDTSVGVCRQCLTTANCSGGRVCDPSSSLCVTPPSTTITAAPANPTNQVSATFAFTSPGNPTATFECSLDGAAFTACASPLTTGVLPAGSHTFTVRAVLGLVKDPTGATRTWLIDLTPPAAPTISAPANGSRTNVNRPTVVGKAEPGARVTVFIDGVPLATTVTASASGDWTLPLTTALADGSHVVSAQATDAAGNGSAMSAFNLFTVDTTPPAAPTIITPAQGGTVGSPTPTITGTAEPGSTVTIFLDGAPAGTAVADGAGNFTFTPSTALAAGPHTVAARATDAVGNVGPLSATTSFTVDLTVLDTSIVSGPPSLSGSSSASFVFSANKAGATFECDLDGAGFVACAAATTFSGLADGAHVLRVRGVKGAEVDATPASASWTVDTHAPGVPSVTAPTGTVATASPTIVGKADPNTTVSVVVDGITLGTATVNAQGDWSFNPPLSLAEGAHTAQAKATDAAGNSSVLSAAQSFTVDTTPPLPPIVTAPVAGATLADSTPTLAGTAEANATVKVLVDGVVVGTVTAGPTGRWSLVTPSPLTDGKHAVKATATDAVGNQSGPSVEVPFTVDTTAPGVPVITSPVNGSALSQARPPITGTADPGSTVTVRIDGAVVGTAVASAGGDWSLTPPAPLSDGPHQATATAVDAVGNTSSASSPVSFTVDTVAPAAPSVTDPTNGQTVGLSSPTVRGTAEANSVVSVIIDSVLAGTVTADGSGNWTFTTAPLSQGQHSVSATSKDAAGNVSPTSAQTTFIVDTTVLDTSILTGPRTPSNATTATFGLASNKSPVTYECRLDAGPWAACTNPATVSGLSQGAHKLEARAVYNSVADATPASYTWTVDTVAPAAPVVTAPVDGARVNTAAVTVHGTAEPGSAVTVILDSGIAGTTQADSSGAWALLLPATLPDGAHTVSATATDAAGNQGPTSVVNTFVVDTIAPAAPIIATPTNGSTVGTAMPVISGTAEPGSTVTVLIDGTAVGQAGADARGAWSYTPTTALADGPHTLSATARDAAGNTGPSATPVQLTVDTKAPAAPTLTYPTDGAAVSDATPTLRGTAEPGSTVTVTVDGVKLGTATADSSGAWTLTPSTPLGEGPHAVTATATDAAGNVSPGSGSITFTVDTVAPTAPSFTSPPAGDSCSATPTLAGTAEAGATVRLSVDGVLVATVTADAGGTFSAPLPSANTLSLGGHTVSADATDAAGNTSASASRAFTVLDCRDAGSDAGAGDGGLVTDGGMTTDAGRPDAGPPDAGAHDAGSLEDGGATPLTTTSNIQGGGCGCGSTDGVSFVAFAALGLLLTRRRRLA